MTNTQAHLSLIFLLEVTYMQNHHLPHQIRLGFKEKWLVLLVLSLTSLIRETVKSDEIASKSSLPLLSTRVTLHLIAGLHQLFPANCYLIH